VDTFSQARTAYGGPSAATRTPRAIEYEAFARVTHRISAAAARGRAGFPDLAAALHDNRSLWALLAAMVADPGNELPDTLRAGLFNLAGFTQRHSAAVLAGTANAEVLVEINTAVMRGLVPAAVAATHPSKVQASQQRPPARTTGQASASGGPR
jgi:flagellar biosynthesis activator protein FlaF